MKIGQRINDLRLRQKVTLKELQKRQGLTASFLSQVERALASPSVSSLEKIAHALNTRVSRFLMITSIKKLFLSGKGEIRDVSIKIRRWFAKRWLRVF